MTGSGTGDGLAARVIPCLDVSIESRPPAPDRARVVKGIRFVDLRDAGDPVELAQVYDREGADELVFLDVAASSEGREIMADVVARTAEQVSIPFAVGGGMRSVDDARRMLRAGADKIAYNTAAVQRPEVLAEAADAFGSQSIVVAVDARRRVGAGSVGSRRVAGGVDSSRDPRDAGRGFEVHTHGGRTPTGIDAVEWCARAAELGAGEILLTSMDRDGTGEGFDVELLRAVTAAVRVPVIASGGAGTAQHMAAGIVEGGASAVLAATIFHFGQLRIAEVKHAMAAAGLAVRHVPG